MNADIKKIKEDKDVGKMNDEKVDSLKNFLRIYYLEDRSRPDYSDDKRNRRLFEVRVPPSADKEATKKALNAEKQLEYTGTDSSEIKTLNKYIMDFFKALGVDTSIFKEDGKKTVNIK